MPKWDLFVQKEKKKTGSLNRMTLDTYGLALKDSFSQLCSIPKDTGPPVSHNSSPFDTSL